MKLYLPYVFDQTPPLTVKDFIVLNHLLMRWRACELRAEQMPGDKRHPNASRGTFGKGKGLSSISNLACVVAANGTTQRHYRSLGGQ